MRWLMIPIVGGAVLALGVIGLRAYNQAMLAADVDQLHRQVLAGGNVASTYENADVRFQTFYPREVFLQYAREHPEVFDRHRLSGLEVLWMSDAGLHVAVIKTRVGGDATGREVSFYCRHAGNNEYRLLGITPDLMAAVPGNLKPYSNAKHRR